VCYYLFSFFSVVFVSSEKKELEFKVFFNLVFFPSHSLLACIHAALFSLFLSIFRMCIVMADFFGDIPWHLGEESVLLIAKNAHLTVSREIAPLAMLESLSRKLQGAAVQYISVA
jgi:hypothetical protein